MGIKQLFNSKSLRPALNSSLAEQGSKIGVDRSLVEEVSVERETYFPDIDFSDPEEFAFYGSAKRYYEDSIQRIYRTFPYDGSGGEKQKWINDSSYLDRYIFDNLYPKTTGYLDFSARNLTTSSVDFGYESFNWTEEWRNPGDCFVSVVGGYRSGISGRDKANIYNAEKFQLNNFYVNGDRGNTVEFWWKLDAEKISENPSLLSSSFALLDVWNEVTINDPSYARFLIEYAPQRANVFYSSKSPFLLTYKNVDSEGNSEGVEYSALGDETLNDLILAGEWHHFSFSVKNTLTGLEIELYVDGKLYEEKKVTCEPVGVVAYSSTMSANICAYRTSPVSSSSEVIPDGSGLAPGMIDEFRFWKVQRTRKQIQTNWFCQVDGGANSEEDIISDLGVYFKFNEGILDSPKDNIVLDYSGRISNGLIENYVSDARSTGSAFDESGLFDFNEAKDPILFPYHEEVETLFVELSARGQFRDDKNNNLLINHLPNWIIEEDEESSGLMANILQVVASYLDTLFHQIKELPKLTQPTYPQNEKYRSKSHIAKALVSQGFIVPDLFASVDIVEILAGRSNEKSFTEKIDIVKNLIYNNIYNNLPAINKTKGTEESFRNLLRCFGIDESLVKLSVYANDANIVLDESVYCETAKKKKYVNFNHPLNFSATVYQESSSYDYSVSQINVPGERRDLLEWSLVSNVVFPKKEDKASPVFFDSPFLTSSIIGLAGTTSGSSDTSNPDPDYSDYRIYCVRSPIDLNDGKFVLEIPAYDIREETDYIRDLYNGDRWLVCLKHTLGRNHEGTKGVTNSSLVFSSSVDTEHFLDFVAYHYNSDILQEEERITISELSSSYVPLFSDTIGPRVYVGARKDNLTGSAILKSDIQIGEVGFWLDSLSDENLREIAKTENFGHLHPSRINPILSLLNGKEIPNCDSKLLHWNFEIVSGSDATGQFEVVDISSGSSDGYLESHYSGKGIGFKVSDSDNVIGTEYYSCLSLNRPDELGTFDTVEISDHSETLIGNKSKFASGDFTFLFEKSPWHSISQEMLKWFAGIVDFNNLIGEPINKYRYSYKKLDVLKTLFFQKVESVSSVERYVEFYKWIDSNILFALGQLVPASANMIEAKGTTIESHVLERNKIVHKFPTIEFKDPDMSGVIEMGEFEGEIIETLEDSIIPFTIHGSKESDKTRYESVCLSGRKEHNLDFVQRNSSYASLPEPVVYPQKTNFTKVVRPKRENVFVNKFSSPGALDFSTEEYADRASAEYSPYNSMNFRNLLSRKDLNKKSQAHCDLFGESTIGETASFHKTNRNPKYVQDRNRVFYDNLFVQHSIPRSDRQYAWVSSSVSSSAELDSHLANDAEMDLIDKTKPFTSWMQTRISSLSVANVAREPSMIKLMDPPKETEFVLNGKTYRNISHKGQTTSSYDESPVSWFKSLKMILGSPQKEKELEVTLPYDSEISYFSNALINNALAMKKIEKPEVYANLRNSLVDKKDDEYKNLVFIDYARNIYPKASLVGNSKVRYKKNYDEVVGTGDNGFDRQTHRKIWDETRQDRGRTYPGTINAVGKADFRNSVWQLDASGSDNSVGRGIGGELNNYGFGYRAFTGHDITYFLPATASILFSEFNRINFPETSEDGMPDWMAGLESGLAPWFDEYSEFVQDLLPLAQGYGIIPEFRISDLIPYYVEEKGGDFRASLADKFRLEGSAVVTSSGFSGRENAQFFNYHGHSDSLSGVEELQEDNPNLKQEVFRLKCSALKKLLPHNGFYPMQRTVQLATLFSSSYGPNISGYSETPTVLTNSLEQQDQWKMQALLQPFYAPGIIYNTVKSGIACDWAAYIGSTNVLETVQPFSYKGLKMHPETPSVDFSWAHSVATASYEAGTMLTMSQDVGMSFWFAGTKFMQNTELENVLNYFGFDWFSFADVGNFGYRGNIRREIFDGTDVLKFIVVFQNEDPTSNFHTYTARIPFSDLKLEKNLDDDKLNHFAFSFDLSEPTSSADRLRLYFEGERIPDDSISKSFTGGEITELNTGSVGSDFFYIQSTGFKSAVGDEFLEYGTLDEISIWNTPLTDAHIQSLYNRGTPGDISQTRFNLPLQNCATWWRMGEGLGAVDVTIRNALEPTEEREVLKFNPEYAEIVSVNTNTVGLIQNSPNFRIPFETVLNLDNYIPHTTDTTSEAERIYLLTPSWYTYADPEEVDSTRYPYFVWNGEKESFLYDLAVQNFFGELPKFFLKNSGLTTILSKKEGEFLSMDANTTYYMDVCLNSKEGNQVFSPTDFSGSYNGRYFGPAVNFVPGGTNPLDRPINCADTDSAVADPAYAPYAPPYFYGKSIARLSFTPIENRRYSLNEILAGLNVEIVHDELNLKALDAARLFCESSGTFGDNTGEPFELSDIISQPALRSAMSVTSSVNIFGITKQKETQFDGTGFNPTSLREPSNSSFDSWAIYPRMETPVFDFNDVSKESGRGPYGMWINYGNEFTSSRGIYLSVEESFKNRATAEASAQAGTGSLLSVCGFQPVVRRLGEVAPNKEIKEAVVAIPFLDRPSTKEEADTTKFGNRYFFKINKDALQQQKARKEKKEPIIKPGEVGQSKEIYGTSITNLLEKMEKYVFPPEFDFLTYDYLRENQPFVMYITEFSTLLDKEDLSNIWQGLMPKPARRAEKEESEIVHPLNASEFFHGKKIPEDIRWLVFKVKQKGEKSYYNLTADSKDDNRFRFDFKVGGERKPEYSYNYPYDFCSLVEYAKIEVGLGLREKEESSEEVTISEGSNLRELTSIPLTTVPRTPIPGVTVRNFADLSPGVQREIKSNVRTKIPKIRI
jgi:hypothetical protein